MVSRPFAFLVVLLTIGAGAVAAQQAGQPVAPRAELSNKKKEKPQDTSVRSLQGTVRDAGENPIEGAVVKIKDTKSLQVRSFITNAEGQYHFHGLSRSTDYEVKADRGELSSDVRRLTVFDDRLKAIINLKLEPKS